MQAPPLASTLLDKLDPRMTIGPMLLQRGLTIPADSLSDCCEQVRQPRH